MSREYEKRIVRGSLTRFYRLIYMRPGLDAYTHPYIMEEKMFKKLCGLGNVQAEAELLNDWLVRTAQVLIILFSIWLNSVYL